MIHETRSSWVMGIFRSSMTLGNAVTTTVWSRAVMNVPRPAIARIAQVEYWRISEGPGVAESEGTIRLNRNSPMCGRGWSQPGCVHGLRFISVTAGQNATVPARGTPGPVPVNRVCPSYIPHKPDFAQSSIKPESRRNAQFLLPAPNPLRLHGVGGFVARLPIYRKTFTTGSDPRPSQKSTNRPYQDAGRDFKATKAVPIVDRSLL